MEDRISGLKNKIDVKEKAKELLDKICKIRERNAQELKVFEPFFCVTVGTDIILHCQVLE
jgi:hypothetical protein